MCNERPGLERMKVGTCGVVRSRVGVGGGLNGFCGQLATSKV